MGEWHLSAAPDSACLRRDGESFGETPPTRGRTNILTRCEYHELRAAELSEMTNQAHETCHRQSFPLKFG